MNTKPNHQVKYLISAVLTPIQWEHYLKVIDYQDPDSPEASL